MNPRREVFAVDYIGETVDEYIKIAKQVHCSAELEWFHDVLKEYFSVTSKHPVIDQNRELFNSDNTYPSSKEPQSIPQERAKYQLSGITYESFYKLCRQRRSVRWYEDKKVPRNLVDKAILAAIQSPSACNRQPFEFRIFDDPQLVRKISEIPKGTVGFTHQFPMVIVVVGNLSAYQFDRDRHLIYIDGSLATMSFMFALETLGLSACPINWPGIESLEKEMSKALGLESYECPILLISVGYPKAGGKIPFSHKKELNQVRKYNL